MVARGRQFKVSPTIRVRLNNPGFVEMRKDPKLVSIFRVRGETWESRLNTELHAAQKARNQPIADGYTHHVHTTGSRARLYVVAFTARAQAHERKHSSILKLMETTKYDIQTSATRAKTQARRVAAKKGAETRRQRRIMEEFERNASGSS